jgi:quercetin dioxygenase-like cupin family protein
MKTISKDICWGIIGALLAFPGIAIATAGAGFLFNYFNRGTTVTNRLFEVAWSPIVESTDHSRRKPWNLQLRVEGYTDFVHQDVALAPNGFSGWHSHPGPVFITVKSGTATWYNAKSPDCEPIVYPAGSSFIEPANASHYVANQGSTDLELLGFYLVPRGAITRQEQPQPSQCGF